jgi:hypothetical protein
MSRAPDSASEGDPLVSRPRGLPRPIVVGGVAAACIAGGALGFWARPEGVSPALGGRQAAPAQVVRPASQRIEIRVDGQPPAARPVAATIAPTPKPAPPPPPPEPLAPQPSPVGLLRVHAVAPVRLEAAPRSAPRAALARPAPAAAKHASPSTTADDHVRAQPARRAQNTHAAADPAARQRRAAQAVAEAERRATEAKARRLKAERLAAEEARKAQQARRQAKRAEARQAHDRAVAAARLEHAKAQRPVRAKPAPQPGGGALRVADAGRRCASPDPREALACADPALASAERQLNRAYREAEAAGVPPERLARQQQRWLAARAAAARQAPWAVHDIYLARIAELQDQTRQAVEGD